MITSKLLLTKYQNGILSLLMKNNRIEEISYSSLHDNGKIGDIYVAKVLNVVKNINAAFIDYQKGKRGYLPLSPKYVPVLLNRTYDGRILAGAQVRSHEIGLVVELLGTCLHQLLGANTNIGMILQRAAHRRDGDIELTRYVLDCYGFHMRIVYATLFPIPDRTAKHNQHGTCHQHIVRVLPFHHAQHGTRQEHRHTSNQ